VKILRTFPFVVSFIALAVTCLQHSVAQNKTSQPDLKQLEQQLIQSVKRAADSTLFAEQRHADSVISSVSAAAVLAARHLELSANSLVTSAGDSLDANRQDALRLTAKSLQRPIHAIEATAKKLVTGPTSLLSQQITRGISEFSRCDDCEDPSDFEDRLRQFQDHVDEVRETFRDTTSTVIDEQRDFVRETHEAAFDSLVDLRDNLIESRLEEIDYQRYDATRLIVSTGYSSHSTYRSRDNGVLQQMIAPSLRFQHSSGFGIEVSTYWLDQTPKRWDDVAASVSYEFTAGSLVSGGLSYSHFWFSDSSRSSQSVFRNAFGASLWLNWPVVSLSVNGDLATGDASEFTAAVSASHAFEIPLTLYNRISIEPKITATIGEQNSSLTILRTKGLKKKRIIGTEIQSNTMFGILGYEMSVPVTVDLGPVTLSPSVCYVKPLNVIDESTTKAFFKFEFGASLAIR
jgi:hypothetical protein